MRTLWLLTGATVFVLGTAPFASALPSLSPEATFAANSSQQIGTRLAKAEPNNNNGKGNAGANNKNTAGGNPGCEKRGEIVSPSKHPNNGFGNCGGDGVPGKSGKQDETR